MEIPRQCPRPRDKALCISGHEHLCMLYAHEGATCVAFQACGESKRLVTTTAPLSECVLRECHVCLRKPTRRAVARHGSPFLFASNGRMPEHESTIVHVSSWTQAPCARGPCLRPLMARRNGRGSLMNDTSQAVKRSKSVISSGEKPRGMSVTSTRTTPPRS